MIVFVCDEGDEAATSHSVFMELVLTEGLIPKPRQAIPGRPGSRTGQESKQHAFPVIDWRIPRIPWYLMSQYQPQPETLPSTRQLDSLSQHSPGIGLAEIVQT